MENYTNLYKADLNPEDRETAITERAESGYSWYDLMDYDHFLETLLTDGLRAWLEAASKNIDLSDDLKNQVSAIIYYMGEAKKLELEVPENLSLKDVEKLQHRYRDDAFQILAYVLPSLWY